MTLEKAQLFALDGNEYDIKFMFNPKELEFSRSIRLNSNPGARSRRGQPKISFANPEPCVLTLNNILFDQYEAGDSGADALETVIKELTKAVQFIDDSERPPIYFFIWGSNNYLRCFVESFKYKLTMFLPNGRPVRATATLVLKEADDAIAAGNRTPDPKVRRFADTRASRSRS